MAFSFDMSTTAGVGGNTTQQLQGNKIHEVIFDGCELSTIDFKDGRKGNVIDVKFHNEEGSFNHRIFELGPDADKDTDNAFGGKNPSQLTELMFFFKHLLTAVNPELANKIDSGEVKVTANNWEQIRQLFIKATDSGKGTTTKIKLIKDKNGYARFPGFFMAYTRDGRLYQKTYFIGNNIFFNNKELDAINKQENAKPTNVETNMFSLEANKVLETKAEDNPFGDLDLSGF